MEVLIGIDIGSTGIKCVAINEAGVRVGLYTLPSAGLLRDGARLFGRVCEVCRAVVSALPSGAAIRGVAAASIGCAAFCLDKNGAQIPLDPDSDGAVMRADCPKVTGYPSDYINAGRLLCGSAGSLTGVAHVLSVADYIVYRLSGEFARDLSTAGSMSMYDRRANAWWDYFKETSGLDDSVLGKPYPSGTLVGGVTGHAAAATGIPEGTPVALGGHDYLCAAFALGCVGEGSVFNVLGTYEMVASFSLLPVECPPGYRAFSDCHCYPGRYSLTCESLSGGQLEWLRRSLPGGREPDFWERIFAGIEKLPPSFEDGRGEIFIPRIFGDCFPRPESGLRGGFLGLSAESDALSMVRAAVEGLCMYSRRMFELISPGKPGAVIVAGGGSRSRFWLQTKADIVGLPFAAPQLPEAAATGAALLAGVGAGVYSGYGEAAKVLADLPKLEFFPDERRSRLFERIYREIFLPALDNYAELDHKINKFTGGVKP